MCCFLLGKRNPYSPLFLLDQKLFLFLLKPPKKPRGMETGQSLGGNKIHPSQEKAHPMGSPSRPVVRCKRSPSAVKIGPLRTAAATLLSLLKLCFSPKTPQNNFCTEGCGLRETGAGAWLQREGGYVFVSFQRPAWSQRVDGLVFVPSPRTAGSQSCVTIGFTSSEKFGNYWT